VLVALAASPRFVTRVVERQLLLAAVPAAVLGAVVGFLPLIGVGYGTALMFPVCVLGAGLAAALGALIAARVVRPVILESSTPDNLRAP
jgi:TctA family transporter